MGKFMRILKHRLFDERDAQRALGAPALARIEQRVTASERHHSGEIRVCVEAGLPMSYLWRDATARERAVAMFGKLRVWDTADNNGDGGDKARGQSSRTYGHRRSPLRRACRHGYSWRLRTPGPA